MGMGRGTLALLATAAAFLGLIALWPAAAGAEVTSVFGGEVDCEVTGDGTRFCGGANTVVDTFDGQPIDVNVALPPEPASGPDGPYPLVLQFHGYGGSEFSLEQLKRWTDQGYAAFTMSNRGFGPCGAKPVPPAYCADGGWVRLLDTRYEVRDAQYFAGRLVDEGIVDPAKIAASGGSYGGGLSMALAALRIRVMMEDGSLVPWVSPEGTPIALAAAIPQIPWTDLAYSLMPNGRTLDYVADAPYTGRVGVMKQTFVTGLYASGEATGFYAPPGADPDADLRTWFTRINAGEPYDDPLIADILEEVTTYHSSYYIDHSIEPAPLLISNGWTDDIFPPDEAIRFYNRTRTEYPDADISLFFLDYGHQRGQSKEADVELLLDRQDEFLAHHLAGGPAPDPTKRVTTLTQTCPGDAPSGGPYTAPSWAQIAPGEVRGEFADPQTIAPSVPSDAPRGQAYDPIASNNACASPAGSDQAGAASYRLAAAPSGGYTLMGSPTVIADFTLQGPTSQVAARLLDVAPDGNATLVARGSWRPATGGTTREVFQLHPNGWQFAEGHVPKLELLPVDAPYGRPSNEQAPVEVANLELRLPVLEEPGGVVSEPAPKVVPDGYELAPEWEPVGSEPLRRCRGRGATVVARAGEVAKGTAEGDVIVGTPRADEIRGRRGDDLVCARGGRDTLRGGAGDDELWGGRGRDTVGGGPGSDEIDGKPERRRR